MTTSELLEKAKSLSSFKKVPENIWILGVRNDADIVNKPDDMFYIFQGEKFLTSLTGSTNPGTPVLTGGFLKYNKVGAAVVKSNEWYYDVWKFGMHQGKMKALRQVGPLIIYRDGDKDSKSEEIGTPIKGLYGINFHGMDYNSLSTSTKETVGEWSAGCQVCNETEKYYDTIPMFEKNGLTTYVLLNLAVNNKLDVSNNIPAVSPVINNSGPRSTTSFSFNITPTDTSQWEDKQYENPQDLVDEITGKMIFKVDSGPGPVLGIGEVEIIKGVATFKGLEFKEPGEYTITIKSTVNNILPKTIKIKVLEAKPESTIKPDVPVKIEGERAFITQIDQPTIKVPEVNLKLSTNDNDNLAVASGIGVVPFVIYNFRLNGVDSQSVIKEKDISYLKLYHDGILPSIEMIFNDANSIFKDNPPTDDKKIRFYLSPGDNSIKSINMQFRITDFKNLSKSKYRILATLDVPDLYKIDYQSYLGTSVDALRQICKKIEIGFNSNITTSDDLMSWRNVGDKYHKFINDIIKHSYVSEKSFMRGFIDYYYCLNFVDVEKEMNRDIKNDVCVDTPIQSDSATEKVSLFLTNDDGVKLKNSNRYFKEKNFINNSSKINLTDGIRTKTKFYDKVKKMFLIFDVDGTTSDGSKSLILKGDENDKKSFEDSVINSYSGKIDTDNVHKNYNYTKTQNRRNLRDLEKIRLDVELSNPNYSIYLYQKIDVKFVNPVPSMSNQDQMNWRKSGEYIVTEISFVWSNKKLVQLLSLSRKELGKNLEEMASPDTKPKQDKKTDNSPNPLPPGAKLDDTIKGDNPNSIYSIGDKFVVRNNTNYQEIKSLGITQSDYMSTYRVFILEITGINPNGIDVTTKIKEIIPNTDEYRKYVKEKLPEIPKGTIDVNEGDAELNAMKKDLSTFQPAEPITQTTDGNKNTGVDLKGKKMLIIGDSQSAIKGDSGAITYTYPNMLKTKLKEIGVELDVLAKGGQTTAWMIENLPGQLKTKYDIVMFYGGGNDASNSSYEISLTPSASKKGKNTDTLSNIQKMVDMCVAQGADVFVNLGYKFEDPNFKGTGAFGNYKLMQPTKYQEKSEDWIPFIKRKIELQNLLPNIKNVKKFIPIYDLNGATKDGIHPTQAGHKIVSDKVYDEIFTKYYNAGSKIDTNNKDKVTKQPDGSWNYIFGDSIAAGIAKNALGLNRKAGGNGDYTKDDKGISKVGANPKEILEYLKDSSFSLNNKIVILSSGYSNGGGTDSSKNYIKQQFEILKSNSCKVYVIGITNNPQKNPNLSGGNDWLEKTSKDYGFKFLGGFEPSSDYLHPKDYKGYWNSVKSKLG